ncbi:hypothetical protein [Vulcanisaeta sp. JCM 16159]|uniref:hypothetical protein n=1 Tax=Vulcanisaeta sp. JCM 16159 TaxID=1295371 RepID=UPI0006D274FE|nr:hypothetical protein [Vulcanisaeta sp. JCM 16159]
MVNRKMKIVKAYGYSNNKIVELINVEDFKAWLKRYACRINAGVFSIGAIRLLIEYAVIVMKLREEEALQVIDALYYKLLVPLHKEGLIELASASGFQLPTNVWDAVVNIDRDVVRCSK